MTDSSRFTRVHTRGIHPFNLLIAFIDPLRLPSEHQPMIIIFISFYLIIFSGFISCHSIEFLAEGGGDRVQGSGFRKHRRDGNFQTVGFRVDGFTVQDLRSRVRVLGFRETTRDGRVFEGFGFGIERKGLSGDGSEFRVQELVVGVWGSGLESGKKARRLIRPLVFKVQGSGFRVQSQGFRVQDSEFRVQGEHASRKVSGFRVQGSGSRV